MDGGKGQVNVALQVLEDLNLNIPVCGMVKDDFHRTRGLYFQNEEISIENHPKLSALLHEFKMRRIGLQSNTTGSSEEKVRYIPSWMI